MNPPRIPAKPLPIIPVEFAKQVLRQFHSRSDEAIIEAVRGDAHWFDADRIVMEIMDWRNPPSRNRRFWYIQITASEEAWVDVRDWDRCLTRNDIPTGIPP
ncbi:MULTISPECIES: hypothetical protein [Amycolatopsis]|uniref:Uncharacterized protein n=1 Tax=Amycolatopsis albidoflavus TaxID=102226 RepID=A0ABW5I576_9PSEU